MRLLLYRLIRRASCEVSKVRASLINMLHPYISIGSGTLLETGATLSVQWGGSISLGRDCVVAKGAQLLTHGGNILIGDDSTVNPFTVVYGQGGGKNRKWCSHSGSLHDCSCKSSL